MEDRSPSYRIGTLAAKTGVKPERLRAWEARYGLLEPDRSYGNYRLYSREDEARVRLMQRHLSRGLAAAEAAELARKGVVSPSPARLGPGVPAPVAERSLRLLRRAFQDFDSGAAEQALDDLFGAFTVEAVLRDAVLPFLRELGDAWARGSATVGQEHFAASLIGARLMTLARGWGTGTGPRALLASPPGERHTMGLMSFGVVLARRGWRVVYLGEDTPPGSIEHAARRTNPSLVMLAALQPRWFRAMEEELTALAAAHPVAIAGAGASNALATRTGTEWIENDPVSAATEIASRKTKRPAEAGRLELGGWDSNPQPFD
ncbi:MAG: MerR family transcriptional regulator, light-induced transcriptional regulator [Thermoleophilaceae bacterium]|nr:MerR family transcriptional regulator, light-induced transcriptional regulator [Thermoleophilaceae bacterium]